MNKITYKELTGKNDSYTETTIKVYASGEVMIKREKSWGTPDDTEYLTKSDCKELLKLCVLKDVNEVEK